MREFALCSIMCLKSVPQCVPKGKFNKSRSRTHSGTVLEHFKIIFTAERIWNTIRTQYLGKYAQCVPNVFPEFAVYHIEKAIAVDYDIYGLGVIFRYRHADR